MLWAVGFLGRIVSDAQLVFGFALFVFGKSVRWAKKDRLAQQADVITFSSSC